MVLISTVPISTVLKYVLNFLIKNSEYFDIFIVYMRKTIKKIDIYFIKIKLQQAFRGSTKFVYTIYLAGSKTELALHLKATSFNI
jgi:hypothetical protein